MTDPDYSTVLDRIFIRCLIEDKWKNISLREALEYQDLLNDWLTRFSGGYFINKTPEIPITEDQLINIIKWLDKTNPPTRLRA